MIINKISDIKFNNIFFECKNFLESAKVFLKIEGLNIAGSIKLKPAIYLIDHLESVFHNKLKNYKIIESSSGNLGIALSIVCKERGYKFTCVTDVNTSPEAEKYIRLYGGEIIKVTQTDSSGGYLETRINLIKKLLSENSSYLWTNQYANINNPYSHKQETAQEIFDQIPNIDYLFIGAGTTGTLLGCAEFFKKNSPHTVIIAVDAFGSVTFGFPASKRYVPGIGTSRKPELVNDELIKKLVDDIVLISEKDGVKMCHHLLNQYGLFVGGSTGSIMHCVRNYQHYKNKKPTIVAISPDLGHKYIDTVYNPEWTQAKLSFQIKEEING